MFTSCNKDFLTIFCFLAIRWLLLTVFLQKGVCFSLLLSEYQERSDAVWGICIVMYILKIISIVLSIILSIIAIIEKIIYIINTKKNNH